MLASKTANYQKSLKKDELSADAELIVSVASGKGGTGKTTVALGLASALIKANARLRMLDCDVEAPNAHLFLGVHPERIRSVHVQVPKVDPQRCQASGVCRDVCEFGAILLLGRKVLVLPELCHACDACIRLCPEQALSTTPHEVGWLEEIRHENLHLVFGRLKVGTPSAVPVIKAVWEHRLTQGITIVDGPPGSSCALVETLHGSDYVLLVTEPTPFGFHDLKKAMAIVRAMNLPMGVVMNRIGIGDDQVQEYLNKERVPILMEIPHSMDIAKAYSKGQVLTEACPEYEQKFLDVYERIRSDVARGEGP